MTIFSICLYILGFCVLMAFFGKIKEANESKYSKDHKKAATPVLIVALLFIGAGYWAWPGESKQEKTSKVAFDHKAMEVDAYVMSQEFIKKQLKAPATADFPLGSDGHVKYMGDSVFYIESYVDAQNSFGANLRNNYSGTIKFKGNDNWINIDLLLKENQ